MSLKFLSVFFVLCSWSCRDKNLPSKFELPETQELIIYNWEEYTPLNVIDQFEKETGIKVVLKTFQTLDEQVARLQSKPDMCDLLVVDTEEGEKVFKPLQIIEDLDNNLFKNDQQYHSLYERVRTLGVPYCFGMVGLAVDKRYVDTAIKNYGYLLKPEFKNKMSLLDEPVDLYDLCLNGVGLSVNNELPDSHQKAVSFARELKALNPIYQDVYSGLDALVNGDVWLTMAYSGEALIYQQQNPNIEFIYPLERPVIWGDMVTLNANAPNKKNAYRFLEFINTPQVAAEIAVQFKYAPGILGADRYMDIQSLNNPIINIPKTLIETCEITTRSRDAKSKVNELYQILTSEVNND